MSAGHQAKLSGAAIAAPHSVAAHADLHRSVDRDQHHDE
jgi:hypothetical protein